MFNDLKERILADEELSAVEFIEVLAGAFPLLLDLEKTDQDEQWHAEGDVLIHTDMVLAEVYEIMDTEDFSYDDKVILIFSALFHDIAKPLTTKRIERDGRECLICPNHEELGRSYLSLRLLDAGFPALIAKQIADLVGYHQMPKRLLIRDAGYSAFAQLSRQVDLRLLYYLELADMRGRICQDRETQIEWIELFKEEVIRHDLWSNKPYISWLDKIVEAFPQERSSFHEHALAKIMKDFETGLIHSLEEGLARAHAMKGGYAQLIMPCGLSGSGKSTWIQSFADDYEIISLDEIRRELTGKESDQKLNAQVVQIAKERLKVALAKKQKIIYDATNLRKDLRQKLLSLAENYGAYTEIVFFAKPFTSAKKANRFRARQVDNKVMAYQLDRLQVPELQEAHRLLYIDNKNEVFYDSLDL